MGASASKSARAAGSTVRKYPTRTPTSTNQTPAPPKVQPKRPGPFPPSESTPQANAGRSQAVDLDGRDPGLASRLNTLGAVQPNPHFSLSSTSKLDPQRHTSDIPFDMMEPPPHTAYPDPRDNPALRLLEARQRIQDEADRELENVGRRGFAGRKYIDAGTIQLALMRKKRGESDARIEEAYAVKKGRLSVLGRGIVDTVQ